MLQNCYHWFTSGQQSNSFTFLYIQVHVRVVSRAIEKANILYFIFSDAIVIFHEYKDINLSATFCNNSLDILNNRLNYLHFSVAPHKF